MTPNLAAAYVAPIAAESWLTILPVVLMLLVGAVLTGVRRHIEWHAPVAISALCGLVTIDATLLYRVWSDGPMTMVMGRWLPPFGIAFTVDVAGALPALVSALVALACGIHALADIDRTARRYGFFPLLCFLMAGVSGAFLTGDIFNLYVWFEVLLISSFGLMVLGGEREQIDGATKYGLLNLVGTTLFLIATGYLYAIFGTLNMADIAGKVANAGADMPLMTLAALYLAAFSMKAAAFPVNFWLPASYHTPRITVSALFAGLLTKVGVYALLRVLVMLMPGQAETLQPVIAALAIATMMSGAIGAIGASDIRRMLGYWVIAGIGVMLAGLAIGGVDALAGAVFYMVHSMVVMTGLYIMAGLVGGAAGSFDLARLGGLYKTQPFFAALSLMLLFSVSSLPPFSGFWPKMLLVRAALDHHLWWLAGTILLSGFLITFSAGRIFLLGFWRPAASEQEPERLAAIPTAVLAAVAAVTLAIGILPEPMARAAMQAADALAHPAAYIGSVFPEARP